MAAGSGSIVGNGSTFAITSSSGTVGTIISMDPPEESVVSIPDDYLGVADYHELIPGIVASVGPMTITSIADIDDLVSSITVAPKLGVVHTGTLTFRPQTGQNTGATYAGTGFLTSRKVTTLETDTRVMVEYTWQFDGKTGPAYVAGS